MTTPSIPRSTTPIRRGPRCDNPHGSRRTAVALQGRRGSSARAALARAGASARSRGMSMRHFASEVGQGTVEYVGLLLLMATILAAIVGAAEGLGGKDKIGQKVVNQIGNSIDKAGGGNK